MAHADSGCEPASGFGPTKQQLQSPSSLPPPSPLPRHAVVREVSESAGGLPYEAFDLTDSLRLNQVVAAHKAVLHIAGVSETIRDGQPANLPCHKS